MEILLELEKSDIRYNKETNAIEVIWKATHDDSTYKFTMNKGLDFLIKHKATCWLSDIRKQGNVSPANSQWLQQKLMPRAAECGLKKIAAVIKPDIFQEFYVKNISLKAKEELQEMKYFDEIAAANEWLKKP